MVTAPEVCRRRELSVWTHCKCHDCRKQHSRQRKLHRNGKYRRVPGDVAITRIREWVAAGWGPTAIASVCGRSNRWGYDVPTRVTVGPAAAAAIMAADITTATRGYGPAIGAIRRVQALCALGWTIEALADELGVAVGTVQRLRAGASSRVAVTVARSVREGYDRLSMTPGPSARTAAAARSQGCFPPLAWDDIDDPTEQPDPAQVRGMAA